MNPLLDLPARVGVRHSQPVEGPLHHHGLGMDIGFCTHGLLHGNEGIMGHQKQAIGIVYKGIARNSRHLLVGLGKAAVDDKELAVALDRSLALRYLDRHMAVDDVGIFRVEAELRQNPVDDPFLVYIGVVGIFLLHMGLRCRHEIPLEGGHPVFSINR